MLGRICLRWCLEEKKRWPRRTERESKRRRSQPNHRQSPKRPLQPLRLYRPRAMTTSRKNDRSPTKKYKLCCLRATCALLLNTVPFSSCSLDRKTLIQSEHAQAPQTMQRQQRQTLPPPPPPPPPQQQQQQQQLLQSSPLNLNGTLHPHVLTHTHPFSICDILPILSLSISPSSLLSDPT